MPSHWWTDSGLEGFLKRHLIYLFIFIVQISNASFHFMFSSILILFFVKFTQIFLHSRSIRTNWATRKPPANRNDGEHFCIFVFLYLCICVFVYLCIYVFVILPTEMIVDKHIFWTIYILPTILKGDPKEIWR